MGKRHELKYLINEIDHFVWVNRLEKILERDSNDSGNGYSVTTLYFDNCYNKALTDKINGEAIRHKYRIRYYDDDLSLIKLERKSKIHQTTTKVTVSLLMDEIKKIYNSDVDFLLKKDHQLYHSFYHQLKHGLQEPKVIVKYHREVFVHPLGDLRITFDRSIKTANSQTNIFAKDLFYMDVLEPGQTIMEIKFNGMLPAVIRSLIQTGHVMQAASSKYVFSRKYNESF